MAIYEQIPYSNLHNMNLDWIIEKIKECLARVEAGEETIEEAVEEIEALSESVDTRIADVETEITSLDNRVESVEDDLSGKLDKSVATGEAVYGHHNTLQKTYPISADSTPNAIPIRDLYGRLKGPDPANNTDLVNKAYADTKVTQKTTGGLEVYAHNNLAQSPIAVGAAANNIPQRNSHAGITIATAAIQDATDAVNKSYVDANSGGGLVFDLLTEQEDMDESVTFTAPGTWSAYSQPDSYYTRITADDSYSVDLANVILIGIDGGYLKFSRCSASPASGSYTYQGPDGYLLVFSPGSGIIDLVKFTESQPSTSSITTVGYSAGYAPVADLALKSEAQDFIFTVDGQPVTYKVVCVDA